MKRLQGFTLIELMVAMVIGLFLLAGLVQVFFASKQSYRLGDGLSRLQENGRFAQHEINSLVRLAGYKPVPTLKDKQVFLVETAFPPVGSSALGFASEQVIMGVENHDGSGNTLPGSDVLAIRFLGTSDLKTKDCLGTVVDDTETSINAFFVRDDTTPPQLFCTAVTGTDPPATQPLIAGIEDLQFLYGVDSSGDFVVDQYMDATTVSAGSLWPQVISVRIGLLVNTINAVLTEQDTKPHYVMPADASDTTNPQTGNDRLRRQVFSSTVQLRNKTL